jgi:hypothetical protein
MADYEPSIPGRDTRERVKEKEKVLELRGGEGAINSPTDSEGTFAGRDCRYILTFHISCK